jgi:signal transduction histidine kinase
MAADLVGFDWRPARVEVVPLVLLPLSAFAMTVMVATDIGGVAGRRLLHSPGLIVATVLLLSALAGVLCLRRRFPVVAYAASVGITVSMVVLLQSGSLGSTPLYWFAAVALGMRVAGVRLVTVVATGICVDAIVTASVRTATPDGGDAGFSTQLWVALFNATLTTVALALLGTVIAVHRRQVAFGETQLEVARREQQSRTERAVEAERASMARELHDVAAHHLTGMLIQAKNADRLLTADPDTARELMAGVIGQGHRTLDGLRQIVGILRSPDGADVPPQPTIGDIELLVDNFRAAFADVTVTVSADASDVDSGVQLACYRIVQESLSNASRHAPRSTVSVRVLRTSAAVVVQVVDDGGTAGPARDGQGLGLVGMRERVVLLGGDLVARPQAKGWMVRAELPIHGRIAA